MKSIKEKNRDGKRGAGPASRRKIFLITGGIIICAAALLIGVRAHQKGGSGSGGEETAYVDTVANLTGQGNTGGMYNRFSGVVESQDTWSVTQDSESTVKDILVQVGQEVTKGTALFTYDTDKAQDDLEQGQIDLERLNNELSSSQATIKELQNEKKKAKSSDQANYTIQIKEQQLDVKQKQLEIQSKQLDIDKLKKTIANATVTSEIDGVVKSINGATGSGDTTSSSGYTDDSGDSGAGTTLMTIMKTGDLRIKGRANEQNIGDLTQDEPVIVHSRTDADLIWKGKISKIETDNTENANQESVSDGDSSGDQSSNYPFYVELENSTGLMMGQHVYIEPDEGQYDTGTKDGLWLDDYLIDRSDEEHPFVWAAGQDGLLEKREVKLGQYDENEMKYEILDGLTEEDSIAVPDDSLHEGMKTAPMSEQTDDETMYEGGSEISGSVLYEDGMEMTGSSLAG